MDILNIYVPNFGSPNYMFKNVLLDLKTQNNISPLIAGDFNILLSTIVRSSRQKK